MNYWNTPAYAATIILVNSRRSRSATAKAHLIEIAVGLDQGIPTLPEPPIGALRSPLVRAARALARDALIHEAQRDLWT